MDSDGDKTCKKIMGIEIKKEPVPKKTQRMLTIGEYDDEVMG